MGESSGRLSRQFTDGEDTIRSRLRGCAERHEPHRDVIPGRLEDLGGTATWLDLPQRETGNGHPAAE